LRRAVSDGTISLPPRRLRRGDLEVRHGTPDELALFHQDGRPLLNVNTPDDYQRALTLE